MTPHTVHDARQEGDETAGSRGRCWARAAVRLLRGRPVAATLLGLVLAAALALVVVRAAPGPLGLRQLAAVLILGGAAGPGSRAARRWAAQPRGCEPTPADVTLVGRPVDLPATATAPDEPSSPTDHQRLRSWSLAYHLAAAGPVLVPCPPRCPTAPRLRRPQRPRPLSALRRVTAHLAVEWRRPWWAAHFGRIVSQNSGK
jgi:hypothetical protein